MKPKSNWEIKHWGANMPPIRWRNEHKREIHFRACLIALALAGLVIVTAALAVTRSAEGAREDARKEGTE